MNDSAVGRAVRWARKRAGMTQHELADALEMPQPSIARIERGSVIPRTATLIAILKATGHQLAVEPIGPPVEREAIRQRLRFSVPRRTKDALGRRDRDPLTSPIRILRRLRRFHVPFVLIGELAEIAHGSPERMGQVIEVVHARTQFAQDRLTQALDDLGATPSGEQDLKTDVGRLRLLTETAAGDNYEILARTAVRMPIDAGVLIDVAAIEDLIRIRRAGRTPEDDRAAAVLRAIAEEPMRSRS